MRPPLLADRHAADSPAPAGLDTLANRIANAGVAVIRPVSAVAIIGIKAGSPAKSKSVAMKATMKTATMEAAVTMTAARNGLIRGCCQYQCRYADQAESVDTEQRHHGQPARQSIAKARLIMDHKDDSVPGPSMHERRVSGAASAVNLRFPSATAAPASQQRQIRNRTQIIDLRTESDWRVVAGYLECLKATIETGLTLQAVVEAHGPLHRG